MRFTNKDWFWPVKITIYWDIPVNMYYTHVEQLSMSSALGWGPFAFIVKFSRLIFSCVCVCLCVCFLIKGRQKGDIT